MGELRGEGIRKVFPGGVRALDGVSFVVRSGHVLTLLGPSGCGKSTLLRIIAGLDRATEGRLTRDGVPFDDVPPGKRDVGFVFQNYALYPHLTVARNLSLALEVRGLSRAEVQKRVKETAGLLGIEGLLDRRPADLSGGQQQRVALGRALVRRPRLYLMDEPLSNLDAVLRESMRGELKSLFRRLEATVVYVTHDQAEALSLSDEVLVLRDGRALQCAPPLDLYARPADLFTATFVGSPRMTIWRGRRTDGMLALRGLSVPVPAGLGTSGRDLCLGIRPEDVEVQEAPLSGGLGGVVELAEAMGDRTLLTIRVGEEALRVLAAARAWPEKLWLRLPPEKLHWFDAESERRLIPTAEAR
jgi:multiple sugar transport system ATP-binding protein